jgi:hypothetical protein
MNRLQRYQRNWKAEDGFPYEQYAWLVGGIYRRWNKAIHKLGYHKLHVSYPDDDIQYRCNWCGVRMTVKRQGGCIK